MAEVQNDISSKLTADKSRFYGAVDRISAPHVVEINDATNGELGPKMQKLASNYRQIRENIMNKLQIKSHGEYYQ